MMKIFNWIILCSALLISVGSLAGCDVEKGPAEKAGEAIDEGIEEVADEIDDATDAK